jgi:hypothetical protein
MGICNSNTRDTFDTTGEYPDTNIVGTLNQLARLSNHIRQLRCVCGSNPYTSENGTTTYDDIPFPRAVDAYEVFRMLERRLMTIDGKRFTRQYLFETVVDATTFQPFYCPYDDYMAGDVRRRHLDALNGRIDALVGLFR